jgi:hypothetical protein
MHWTGEYSAAFQVFFYVFFLLSNRAYARPSATWGQIRDSGRADHLRDDSTDRWAAYQISVLKK